MSEAMMWLLARRMGNAGNDLRLRFLRFCDWPAGRRAAVRDPSGANIENANCTVRCLRW
jgi:hypothetical protein